MMSTPITSHLRRLIRVSKFLETILQDFAMKTLIEHFLPGVIPFHIVPVNPVGPDV